MKRVVHFLCAASLIIPLLITAVPAGSAYAAPGDGMASITLTLPTGPYTIGKDRDGLDFIQMEGFSQSSVPGDPMLPHRVFNVLVPPDIQWQSLNLRLASTDMSVLEGTYDIKPAPQAVHTYDSSRRTELGQGLNYNLVNGRNTAVYGTDANFPAAYSSLLPYSQMRKWEFTRVDFTPFQYNPVTKKLTYIKSVTIEISYQRSGIQASSALLADAAMDSLAPQLFINFNQSAALYQAAGAIRPQATYDYVVITTSAIQAGSAKLASFVTHKQGKGYSVLVATEAQWGAVTGQAPNTKADKIRKWLQDNCLSYGIQHVLLIGNPSPYESGEGDVPMKMCWPRNNQTWETSYKNTPTDHFYADLTGNWDLDADGYYGEYPHDTNSGGVDLAPEVYVGRIPVYSADYAVLDSILQKTMDYENEGGATWRKSALLPMSFSDSGTDGAYLAEQMKSNYLNAAGYSSWRMYQQGSDCAAANSSFTSEEELRPGAYVTNRWAANDYGIVSWWGHGNTTGAYAGYTGCGSGAFFTSSNCPSLDDAHPSFTYQCSCTNGYPEASNNLQYAILKQGGIGTVGATRVSWYQPGETNFVNSATNAGIGYEYVKRLVAGNGAGNALFSTVQSVVPVNDPEFLMNGFGFNLYGDPSIMITSTASAPTVTNASGATNVAATTATLNGDLTSNGGADTTVHVFWGDNDGGTTAVNWDHDINIGLKPTGTFYSNIAGLKTGRSYYYRCQATNSVDISWANATSSFTPVDLPQKLIGAADTTATAPESPNYFFIDRFIAEATGSINQIRVKASAAGNVKVAVYSDSSGSPGSLLSAVNIGTAVTAGWNNISITPTPVTSGTAYWLGFVSDSPCVVYISGGGTDRYTAVSYSGFTFPSTTPALVSWTGYHLIQGWWDTPPVLTITTTSLPGGIQGTAYTPTTLTASGGSTPYTWSVSIGSLPAGLALNASTGLISGTPSAAGTASFTIQVTDGDAGTNTRALSIAISSPPPLNITTVLLPEASVGTAYSQTLLATGGIQPYTWAVSVGTLPAGLTLNPSTGVISGMPSTIGTANFTIRVTDSLSATDTQVLSIAVTLPVNRLLIGAADTTATAPESPNHFFIDRFTAEATGSINQIRVKASAAGNVKVAVYSDSSGSPGSLLSAVNIGTAVTAGWNNISITPTPVTSGTAYWLGFVSDSPCVVYISGGGTDRYTAVSYSGFTFPSTTPALVSWTGYHLIQGWWDTPPVLTITTTSLPGGIQGTAYTPTTLTASGGSTPYTWSVSIGSLPAGLALNASTGLISGTPSAAGTASFTIQVTDGDAGTNTRALSIAISSPPPLNITTVLLPEASVGTAYSQTLLATGGISPYTWAVSVGTLPAGLTLNPSTGVISGMPSTIGTANFTIRVTDSLSATDTQVLSIAVTLPVNRLLIGAADTTATAPESPNHFFIDRFTAEATGSINQIRVKASAAGNVKVAVYSDSSGSPGSLLSAVNIGTAVTAGWNNISITPTPVTSGTAYWLGFVSDSPCVVYISGGGTDRYTAVSYSGFTFPSTTPALVSWTGYHLIQGWWDTPPAPPSPPGAAPSLLSPGTAITFKWGTVENASKYHLQVNTSSGFTGTDLFNSEVGNVTLQEVTGLSLGTAYYWRVKAGNDAGWGPLSTVRSVITNTVP